MKVKIPEFPQAIGVMHKQGTSALDNVNPKLANRLHQLALKGLVGKDGNFKISPGGMFKCEKLSVGVYKITHMIGYANTTLNIGIVDPPGTLFIKEHHPNYFVVEATLDRVPTDMDWMFTLMKVLG